MSGRIKVGVLRGGTSEEYDISLKTGARIMQELYESPLCERYVPVDLFIDREGDWFADGYPVVPENLAPRVDVIFNALHGELGEDGKVQQILDQLMVPYTGSGAFASAVGMNKHLAKSVVKRCAVKVPQHVLIAPYQEDLDGPVATFAREKAQEVFRQIPPPWIMKPLTGGSSFGIRVVKTYGDLVAALDDAAGTDRSIIVEELISGKEATCGVIEGFRGEPLYALLPSEILPSEAGFHDYEGKYTEQAGIPERTPGKFKKGQQEELQRLAQEVHRELGMRHYSRSDFMVKGDEVYLLEVNSLPGLTEHSLVPKALESVGATMSEFIDHILRLALKKN